jgi:hypothetical protein
LFLLSLLFPLSSLLLSPFPSHFVLLLLLSLR